MDLETPLPHLGDASGTRSRRLYLATPSGSTTRATWPTSTAPWPLPARRRRGRPHRGELLDGHLGPERGRHPHRAAPGRLDRGADRVRPGRRRRLHQRRHASRTCRRCCSPRGRSPVGLAATAPPSSRRGCGSSRRGRGHFSVRRRPGCSASGADAVVTVHTDADTRRMRRRPRARARPRSSRPGGGCRSRSSRRPAPPTSAASTRWRRSPRSPARTASGCTSTPPTAAACSSRAPPAPARRHRARRLGDRRLPQVLLPAGQLQRGAGPRPRRPAARHLPRRLPQPRRERRAAASEPGRQEPADHPPVRRPEALADPAHRSAPTASGSCSTTSSSSPTRSGTMLVARPALRGGRAPELSTVVFRWVPPEPGSTATSLDALDAAKRASAAVRLRRGGDRLDHGRRPHLAQVHAAQPRAPRSTTCARCSNWCGASRAERLALSCGARGDGEPTARGDPRAACTTSWASGSVRSTSASPASPNRSTTCGGVPRGRGRVLAGTPG